MNDNEIESLKGALRARLRREFNEIASARDGTRKAHLEVWESKRGGRVVGVEFDHTDRVNLWLTRLGLPRNLPSTVERTDKEPKGRGWTDAQGDGANSNLSAYKQFVTRPITRLSVRNIAEATAILDHVSF